MGGVGYMEQIKDFDGISLASLDGLTGLSELDIAVIWSVNFCK